MSERTFGRGFHRVYRKDHVTLGIGVPIEAYSNTPVPSMSNTIEMVQQVEQAGFAALWCRDVPLLDPGFGDAGQIYDPWVWLGHMAAHTSTIALGTGSIILPLRRPVDIAKAAASVDRLTGGRLIMGVASGDRPVEYSVYDVSFEQRDQIFRNTLEFIRKTTHRPPGWDDQHAVQSRQVDLLPKSHAGDIPQLVTGYSRQTIDWIATNADGWLSYPRPLKMQHEITRLWQDALKKAGQPWKPFSQSLYIDLTEDPNHIAQPIHLGFRLGRNTLVSHIEALREIGVNHITFNIRFSSRAVTDVISELAEFVIPHFPAHKPDEL